MFFGTIRDKRAKCPACKERIPKKNWSFYKVREESCPYCALAKELKDAKDNTEMYKEMYFNEMKNTDELYSKLGLTSYSTQKEYALAYAEFLVDSFKGVMKEGIDE